MEVSNHTLVNNTQMPFLDDGTVDMGTSFDLMHPASWHDSPYIVDATWIANREILRQAMKRGGFKELKEEWWHYTLLNEPYPYTYFDFVNTCD